MRLIDADALLMNMNLAIAILEGTMKNLGLQDDAECQMELKAYRDIRDGIKDEPTAEPTVQPERKRGEWIPVTYRYVPVKDGSLNTKIIWIDATEPDDIEGVKCSECGTVFDFAEARNWCSECGADMRGGGAE